MKINAKFLPIKAHYFFFMAALGPILPQLNVFGKELGISPVVMGYITGILPIIYIFAKPGFGLVVDIFRDYRKSIFMLLIVFMTVMYGVMNFIPQRGPEIKTTMDTRNTTEDKEYYMTCSDDTVAVSCMSTCLSDSTSFKMTRDNSSEDFKFCEFTNTSLLNNSTCVLYCNINNNDLYKSLSFWSFVLLMSLGTISFNVINSISDAICFDVIGDEGDYGIQRVWGTIGWGVTALIGGYVVDIFSESKINYGPAFIVMLVCSLFDLAVCLKLQLPVIKPPNNIFKDFKNLLTTKSVATFLTFAVFVGILDGLLIYFLFWYVEDMAVATNTSNVKLIEGCIVAAETLGAEVIFFLFAGKIIKKIGHVHCFTMCFVNYALRIALISMAPSPWWIVPIEFFFQGPTYALTYTTIVEYANKLAPPGASATMQGIAAGMDDGVGYAFGSLLAGFLYNYVGGKYTFQIFSVFALLCGIVHALLHKTILSEESLEVNTDSVEYKSPEEAVKITSS